MNTGALRGLAKALADYTLTTGWIPVTSKWEIAVIDGATATGTSMTSFDVRGQATTMGAGDFVRYTNNGAVKYGIIHQKDAYQASVPGRTRIHVYGGTQYIGVAGQVTDISISHERSPVGFDRTQSKWTATMTDTSSRTQASPVQNTWYNLTAMTIDVPIGAWRAIAHAYMFVDGQPVTGSLNIVTVANEAATLSTANNSESNTDSSATVTAVFTLNQTASATVTIQARLSFFVETQLLVTAKTTHFLNIRTTSASQASISLRGDVNPTTIKLVSAYL